MYQVVYNESVCGMYYFVIDIISPSAHPLVLPFASASASASPCSSSLFLS